MEYFYLEAKVKKGTAFARSTIEIVSGEEETLVQGKSELPFGLELVDLKRKGKRQEPKDLSGINFLWVDYQPNEFAWPMMSESMANIIKAHLTGQEGIDWISVPIVAKGESRQYLVPRFSKQLDTLDAEKTTRTSSGLTIRPWFSLGKIKDFAMFHGAPEFWEITPSLVVNEPLMNALKKAKLSGIAFSPARAS